MFTRPVLRHVNCGVESDPIPHGDHVFVFGVAILQGLRVPCDHGQGEGAEGGNANGDPRNSHAYAFRGEERGILHGAKPLAQPQSGIWRQGALTIAGLCVC